MSSKKPAFQNLHYGGGTDRVSSLKDTQLALLSGAVFDVPPRTRLFIAIGGVIGIGLIAKESLVGNQPHTVFGPIVARARAEGYAIKKSGENLPVTGR